MAAVLDYLKLRIPQLAHLAGGGDAVAKKELARRRRDAPAPTDVTRLDYRELRALVLAWRTGETAEDRAQSRMKAEAAQLELEARFRVRARLGWRVEDAPTFGPEDATVLPVAPWLVAPGPRCISWRRPTGSTHYQSEQSISRAKFAELARTHAAGAPHK